jgi:hypothetical protein
MRPRRDTSHLPKAVPATINSSTGPLAGECKEGTGERGIDETDVLHRPKNPDFGEVSGNVAVDDTEIKLGFEEFRDDIGESDGVAKSSRPLGNTVL